MKLHAFVASLAIGASAISLPLNGTAQGTFVNLDFENPIPPLNKDSSGMVLISNALPRWSGFIGTNPVDRVRLANISAGSPEISFHGPSSIWGPAFHGNYSVILQARFVGGAIVNPAIAQVGQIPQSARSLFYYANNPNTLEITFAGNLLPKYNLSGGVFGYQQWGADVSQLAGQTGELRFTGGVDNLDFIQFSSQAIPEPSIPALTALGTGLLGWLWRKRP